jgi:hypothetical protein
VNTCTGTRIQHETTIGWELLVQLKDLSTTWVSLKDVKAYPIQTVVYAVQARIAEEPAFAWWVSNTLKKRYRVIVQILDPDAQVWYKDTEDRCESANA